MKWLASLSMARPRLVFTGCMVILYAGLCIAFGGLTFPPDKDEKHFWPTTLEFARHFPPDIETLRGYNELNTPLPFIVDGAIQRWFGLGIAAGRFLNLALSLAMIFLIGLAGDVRVRAALAAVGLLVFPYFLGTSVYLYTDIMAAFFAMLGLILHVHRRFITSAFAFVLAISSRQYMVAIPLGIAAHELLPTFRWRIAKSDVSTIRHHAPWLSPLIAATSLLGWFIIFGGPAPPAAVADQHLSTAGVASLFPQHALYSLACVGAYFVIIETLLFRSIGGLRRSMLNVRTLWGCAGLIVAFVIYPPVKNLNYSIESMGYLDRVLRAVMGDRPRMAVLCLLACLSCVRFAPRINLALWLVLINALVIMKAHIGWDKYALALLACLWYLTAIGMLNESEDKIGAPRKAHDRDPSINLTNCVIRQATTASTQ